MATLRRTAAIIGLGTTPVGRLPGRSALQLSLDAMDAALDDAGLGWDDIDGLYSAISRVSPADTLAAGIAEHLGLSPAFAMSMPYGGLQFTAAVYQAAAIVTAGVAHTVMLVCADNPLSGMGRGGTVDHFAEAGHPDYENPFGTHVPALYGMMAQRHMHEYGTSPEDLARVAVQMRSNASHHPAAQMRAPITVSDVLSSRPISSPFHLLDCSLISDGGAAFVVTTADRASMGRKPPVFLLGAGEARRHLYLSQSASLSGFGAAESSGRAYAMAGLGPGDIDVATVYDAYTMSTILAMEGLGFCAAGEGGAFVSDGHIAPTGTIPVNPHGGLLSYAHPGRPGGVLLLAEAVEQLRGEARGIQVADANVALVHANAGMISGEVTLILGT